MELYIDPSFGIQTDFIQFQTGRWGHMGVYGIQLQTTSDFQLIKTEVERLR